MADLWTTRTTTAEQIRALLLARIPIGVAAEDVFTALMKLRMRPRRVGAMIHAQKRAAKLRSYGSRRCFVREELDQVSRLVDVHVELLQ